MIRLTIILVKYNLIEGLKRRKSDMRVNLDLKAELIRRFGSQIEGAKAMGIAENRLSYIVRGHIQPSEREFQALEQGLGKTRVRMLLKKKASKGDAMLRLTHGEDKSSGQQR